MSLFSKRKFFTTLFFISFLLFAFKSDVYAATITMPSSLVADTSSYVLLSSSGTTPSVSDFSTDLIVTLSVTNGDLRITITSGLSAPTGYNSVDWAGASEISFEGSQTDVNNALATLAYQGDGSATTTLSASATPTGAAYNPSNGHYYDYVGTTNVTWSQAKAAASASTFNGLTGYLVTITSVEENNFVRDKGVGGVDRNVFIGATDSASEGVWIWDTGPEAGTQFWSGAAAGSAVGGRYENWATNEPQGGAGENYAEYYNTGLWNDVAGGANAWTTYVIEYGGLDGETATVFADTTISITSTQDSDPLVISFSPENNETDVAIDSNLVLTFSEAVDAESGNILLYKSDDTLIESFDVSSEISGSGTETITINPTDDLSGSETYYVKIDASAFDDADSNSYAGINDSTTWTFSTVAVIASSTPDPDEEDTEIIDEVEDEPQKAYIASWKAYRYENTNGVSCPNKLKLIIKGKHFAERAKVKIGGQEAYDIDRKNSHRIVARFCFEDLLDIETDHNRVVRVNNPGAREEEADKKIHLDEVSFESDNNSEQFDQNTEEGTRNIQETLINLGYLDAQYSTGFFGSITKEAIKKYQADNGLPETGYVGPLTIAKFIEK